MDIVPLWCYNDYLLYVSLTIFARICFAVLSIYVTFARNINFRT